jgi:hypothetical protein
MSVKKALLRTIDRGPGLGAIEIRFNIGKADHAPGIRMRFRPLAGASSTVDFIRARG